MNVIIDASNVLNRNYFIYKGKIDNGESMNFYDFFFQSIRKFAARFDATSIYLVWDKKINPDIPNFRKVQSGGEYKGNRNHDHYEEMLKFVPGIEQISQAMGIYNMYPYSTEADDVVAWLAFNLTSKSVIVSADKDLCQLISKNVIYFNLAKNEEINIRNFKEKLGVSHSAFVLKKCIQGDGSDNIKGIKGYGEVKSAKLAEEMITDINKLKNHPDAHLIKENMKLMSLQYALKSLPDDVRAITEQYQNHINPVENNGDKPDFISLCKTYKANYLLRNKDDFCYLLKTKEDSDSDDDFSDLRELLV